MTREIPIHLACIDLGSNSFHCHIFAYYGDGHIESIAVSKAPVKLRAGMDQQGVLSDKALQIALDCLAQFATLLSQYHVEHARVIGTYTLRSISNRSAFVAAAQHVLSYPIEIISGEDEAYLIFQGATSGVGIHQPHLFIDIGGGSTELIVGDSQGIIFAVSLDMGSATAQQQYFMDGVLSKSTIQHAVDDLQRWVWPLVRNMPAFTAVLGSGGTMRALCNIARAQGQLGAQLSAAFLSRLADTIATKGAVEQLQLPGLRRDREPVLVGGLCVLLALFERFEIDIIGMAQGGVREGMLAGLINEIQGG